MRFELTFLKFSMNSNPGLRYDNTKLKNLVIRFYLKMVKWYGSLSFRSMDTPLYVTAIFLKSETSFIASWFASIGH